MKFTADQLFFQERENMKESVQSIRELLKQAKTMPHGPTKISMLKKAIDLSDSFQQTRLGFRSRRYYLDASRFGGSPSLRFAVFSWCLGQCDRDPDQFDENDLLWEYKWMISEMINNAEIPQRQLFDAIADMKKRYERNGLSLKPVYKLQRIEATDRGDFAAAKEYNRLWQSASKDGMNDPDYGDRNDFVSYLVQQKLYEKALKTALPILDKSIPMDDNQVVPHSTLGHIVVPTFLLKKYDDARRYHQWGIRLIRNQLDYLEESGKHLMYTALSKNYAKGLQIIEWNAILYSESINVGSRFVFSLGAVLLFRLMVRDNIEKVSLRVSKENSWFRPDGEYSVPDLLAVFEEDCKSTADAFDQRNGSKRYMEQYQDLEELASLAIDQPISYERTEGDPSED